MSPRYPMHLVLVLAIFFGSVCVANAETSLDGILTPYLAHYDLPAWAATVVQDGKIIASGAVGTRRAGAAISGDHQRPLPYRLRYQGHDGFVQLPMLVEENKLRWDSTVAEVFPELSARPLKPRGLREVTLEQLLSHTSGIPSDNQEWSYRCVRVFIAIYYIIYSWICDTCANTIFIKPI